MVRYSLIAIAALALAPATANAQNFNDNFNNEGPAGSTLNYGSFTNFTTTGQVDLVSSPDYGIICDGKCVDLDGIRGRREQHGGNTRCRQSKTSQHHRVPPGRGAASGTAPFWSRLHASDAHHLGASSRQD